MLEEVESRSSAGRTEAAVEAGVSSGENGMDLNLGICSRDLGAGGVEGEGSSM
jgi:hypothetical protein